MEFSRNIVQKYDLSVCSGSHDPARKQFSFSICAFYHCNIFNYHFNATVETIWELPTEGWSSFKGFMWGFQGSSTVTFSQSSGLPEVAQGTRQTCGHYISWVEVLQLSLMHFISIVCFHVLLCDYGTPGLLCLIKYLFCALCWMNRLKYLSKIIYDAYSGCMNFSLSCQHDSNVTSQ